MRKVYSSGRAGRGFFPAWYAGMAAAMTMTARRHGYALALHGSMSRDLDMIAVAWTEWAVTPRFLVDELVKRHGLLRAQGRKTTMTRKPHGRLSVALMCGGNLFVDLSIVPPQRRPAPVKRRKGKS